MNPFKRNHIIWQTIDRNYNFIQVYLGDINIIMLLDFEYEFTTFVLKEL
jgi:hypothetical protein